MITLKYYHRIYVQILNSNNEEVLINEIKIGFGHYNKSRLLFG